MSLPGNFGYERYRWIIVLLEVVMWKIPKQSYTDEFKVEAVRLVQAGQQARGGG